jgi:hypothetical protein
MTPLEQAAKGLFDWSVMLGPQYGIENLPQNGWDELSDAEKRWRMNYLDKVIQEGKLSIPRGAM